MKKPFGDNAARFIGLGKGTETQSFFMPVILKEGKRTPFWGFGMMMAFGVRIRKVSLPRQYLFLKRFIPPPLQVELVRLLMHYLDVSLRT